MHDWVSFRLKKMAEYVCDVFREAIRTRKETVSDVEGLKSTAPPLQPTWGNQFAHLWYIRLLVLAPKLISKLHSIARDISEKPLKNACKLASEIL